MAGLYNEVWIREFEGVQNARLWKTRFLNDCKEYSQAIEGTHINLSYFGTPPAVVVDQAYPLALVARTDSSDRLAMKNYQARPIAITPAMLNGIAVDPTNSYLADMRETLMAEMESDGIYTASPLSNTAATPIVTTPAANPLGADGYRVITTADVSALAALFFTTFPKMRGNARKPVLQVSSADFNALASTDNVLVGQEQFKGMLGEAYNYEAIKLFGIIIVPDDRTPVYSNANARLAKGTVAVPGTNRKSATLYVPQVNVIRGYAGINFYNEPSATYQGELISANFYGYAGANATTAGTYEAFGAITKTN